MQTHKGRRVGLETGIATTTTDRIDAGRRGPPHGPTRLARFVDGAATLRATTLGLVVLAVALLATPLRDVPLVFDSLSYAAQGDGLARGHGNVVSIGGELHPGIYPIGVPLLVAPAIAVAGDLRAGVWSILVCGVLCVLATAAVARRAAGAAAGAVAGLLLLSSGAFRDCAANIFSQVPTALAVVATTWLFVTARGPGRLAGAGALAVLSVLLRCANAGFPLALVAATLVAGPGRRARRTSAVVAGMVPAALVVLAHNAALYGDPWCTGYDAWGWSVGGQYSLSGVGAEAWTILGGAAGFGRLYSVPLALAALFGIRRAWRRRRDDACAARLAALTVAAVAAQYAVHVPHAFFAEIYLVPTVPLLAATAAVGVVGARVVAPRTAVAAAAALIAVSLLGDVPLSRTEVGAIRTHAGLRVLADVAEDDAVLFTAAAPALAEPVFLFGEGAGGREVVYLEVYATGPLAELGRRQFGDTGPTPELVLERATLLLRSGRPTYYALEAPAAGLKPRHRAMHAAVRKNLALRPTGIEGICRLDLPRGVE